MLTLTTRARLGAAIDDPRLDANVRALLRLRLEQTGGEGAHFHLLQATEGIAEAERAVGWPMADEGEPCWEWARVHPGGIVEVVFVLSDEGPAQVLVVPPDADAALLDLLRLHAAG